jgi:phosphoribosylamine---glycine ligase
LADAAAGRLDPSRLKWKPGASVCVVLASRGYPGKFTVGQSINGLTDVTPETGVTVFHAGTRLEGSSVASNGGRVLGVTAARPSVQEAVSAVYSAISKIGFDGMQYRRDIAGHASHVGAAGD